MISFSAMAPENGEELAESPGQPDSTTRIGVCLAALVADHAAPGPGEVHAALRAAADAGTRSLSIFAAHAAAAVAPVSHPQVDTATALVAALKREHRRAAALLDEGALWPLVGTLAELDLRIEVLEFATAWAGGEAAVIEDEVSALCRVAAYLGAGRVLAVCTDPSVDAAAAGGLARTADVAAEHGMRVCLEFTALFGVQRLEDAIELIDRAARPNLGFVIDTFHWRMQPGGADPRALARLDPARIEFVQIAGAVGAASAAGGENLDDNFSRAMPDEDSALPALLAAIGATAARPFVAGEVFDHRRLRDTGAAEYARDMARSVTRAALRAKLAGVSSPGDSSG